MGSRPTLQHTDRYDLFEMHDLNRNLHEKPELLASMKAHGFMPSCPIHCQRNGEGKLKVIRGHHRLDYAKRLSLRVYYIVDETDCDIFELEGVRRTSWSGEDWANARSKAGDVNCRKLLAFQRAHGLPLNAAASLVGGESAPSNNKVKLIKTGAFRVGDMTHANEVVSITDMCRDIGIPFATTAGFVGALSMVLRIPEIDLDTLRHRMELHGTKMARRARLDEYLAELESLYNYGARGRRMPVAFRAVEVSRERQATFGGRQKRQPQ